MELNKARDIAEIASKDSQWILWVDGEIWGYVNTLDDAKKSIENLSSEIKRVMQLEHPHYTIECLTVDDKIKVKCLNPGWVYNSKWTAHTVFYQQICKFNLLTSSDSLPYPLPSIVPIQMTEESDVPHPPPPPVLKESTQENLKYKPARKRRNRGRAHKGLAL